MKRINRWVFEKLIGPFVRKRRLKGLNKYGEDVRIGKNCRFEGHVECGSHVSIGEGAYFVSTKAKLIIQDHCVFGPNVTVYTGDHAIHVIGKHIIDITDEDKDRLDGGFDKDVIIEEGCWIGTRAIILKGVRVGKGSVIGAGSVVTKDVPPYSVYVGSPPSENISKVLKRANFGTRKQAVCRKNGVGRRMKNLYHKIKAAKARKYFFLRVDADTESLTLMPGAACHNTGNKENVKIGKHCTIGCLFQALYGGVIEVGCNTYIGPQTVIQSKEHVYIGNCVVIANNVLIVDNNNHPTDPSMRLQMSACDDFLNDELWSWKYADSKPIVIEDNVWIGRDSRIMKGVTIGRGSIVALGAVVTKDVPSYTIVAGNPARVVKNLSKAEREA